MDLGPSQQGRGVFVDSCPRSWIRCRPLSSVEGLHWVTSTACRDPWALRSQQSTHSHLQDMFSFWCICSMFVGSDLCRRRAGGCQVLTSFWCWCAGLSGTAHIQTRQLPVPAGLAAAVRCFLAL